MPRRAAAWRNPPPRADERIEALCVKAGERPGTCRDCGATIYWATVRDRRVPVDTWDRDYAQAPTATADGWGTRHRVTCKRSAAGTTTTRGDAR